MLVSTLNVDSPGSVSIMMRLRGAISSNCYRRAVFKLIKASDRVNQLLYYGSCSDDVVLMFGKPSKKRLFEIRFNAGSAFLIGVGQVLITEPSHSKISVVYLSRFPVASIKGQLAIEHSTGIKFHQTPKSACLNSIVIGQHRFRS